MTCPYCHAENEGGAAHCARCGKVLTLISEAETFAGDTVSADAPQREAHDRQEAIGVATPLPKSLTQTPTAASVAGLSVVLEAGADFGPRYRILSLLGKGGMGLVYKARDLELDRVVALKLLRSDLTADPGAMQRFKQELLLASKISHRNVLRIHDLGEVGGVKFISMAYVEGQDLHQLLKNEGRVPPDRAVELARQLAAALDAAHSEGIVHRDLKPQNVLIDRDGNALVSDFGLAKSLETGAAEMTQAGQLLGTPRYMSPEQVQGGRVDARTDIYALGLILYEMVTGDIPFKSDSVSHLMLQRLSQRVKTPKALNPDVPDYFARIILRCLELNPARRYPSAREILLDLEAAHATPSRHGTVQITLGVPEKRRWIYAIVAAVIAAIIVGVFLIRRPSRPRVAARAPVAIGIPPLTQGKYLAVLPFRVLGDKASLGYIAQGLNQALSARLFGLKGVHVASPDAAERAAQQGSLAKTAQSLGINLAVQGTVEGSRGKIAIVANLVDVASGRLLWAQEFTGVPQDLLTLEDQISGKLTQALNLHPQGTEQAAAAAHPTENVAAYQLYLKGQDGMRGLPDAQGTQKAIELYQQALNQDPAFALAYAGLANASLRMYTLKKDRFWVEQALAAAEQARQNNSTLPQVYMALGNVYSSTGKNAEAVEMLRHAVRLAPNSDEAWRLLGKALQGNGKLDEAIAAYKKAVGIDPYYWVNANELGKAYVQAGDFRRALGEFQHVVQLEPNNAAGYENIGGIHIEEGNYSQAIPSLERALQLNPTFGHYWNLGLAYVYVKRFADAAKAFEKAGELAPNQEQIFSNLGEAYYFGGEKQKAQEALNRAIALGNKDLQVNPRDADTLADLAIDYVLQGEGDLALHLIRSARSISPRNPTYVYNEAVVQALLGKPAPALAALREAFQMGFPVKQAVADPQLASLQTLPDFKNLTKQFQKELR